MEDCKKTITSYEDGTIISCAEDLISEITLQTSGAKQSINNGELPSAQYDILINKLIANCSFDLLVSGKYHIYRGVLDPLRCGESLMKVREKSLQYALQNNLSTKEEIEEDARYLKERLSEVG